MLSRQAGIATHCNLAIPTYGLWYACYIAIMVMVAVVIPFTMFYYEADSETCVLPAVWVDLTVLSCLAVTQECQGLHRNANSKLHTASWMPPRSHSVVLSTILTRRHSSLYVLRLGRTLAQRLLSACAYSGITAVIIAALYGFAYGAHYAHIDFSAALDDPMSCIDARRGDLEATVITCSNACRRNERLTTDMFAQVMPATWSST